jgi:hypothetical protein
MKTHTTREDSVENKVAEVAKALSQAQLALFDVYINELIDKMTVREADLIVKKMKSIRKNINVLIGEETTQKGNQAK